MRLRRILPIQFTMFPMLTAGFFLCAGCGSSPQAVEDLMAIRSMFAEFKTALQQDRGVAAAALVSSSSVDRFEQFRVWALNDSEEELANRSVLEQIETLRLRRLFRKEDLAEITGRDVVSLLVNEDQLPTPFVEDAILGEPVFKDRICYIQIFDEGGAIKEKLVFVKEGEHWKVDLAAMEYVQESIYRSLMRRNHLDEAGVVESVVTKWGDDIDMNELRKPLNTQGAT